MTPYRTLEPNAPPAAPLPPLSWFHRFLLWTNLARVKLIAHRLSCVGADGVNFTLDVRCSHCGELWQISTSRSWGRRGHILAQKPQRTWAVRRLPERPSS